MKDYKLILIIVLIVVVGLLVWRYWINKPSTTATGKRKPIWSADEDVNRTEEVPVIVEAETPETSGQTMANIDARNYKGVNSTKYYLTYSGDAETQIEEISEAGYLQFITEYPTGIAQGNKIKQYRWSRVY